MFRSPSSISQPPNQYLEPVTSAVKYNQLDSRILDSRIEDLNRESSAAQCLGLDLL